MDKTTNWKHSLIAYLDKPYQEHNVFSRLFLQTWTFIMFESTHYIAPLSFVLIPILLLEDSWSFLNRVLFIYLTAEVGHYFYTKTLIPKLNISRENMTMTQNKRKEMTQLVMDLEPEPIKVFNGWLLKQLDYLELSHYGEYIAMTFFSKRLRDFNTRDFKDSLELLQIIQKKTNIAIGGNTASLPCYIPLFEPITSMIDSAGNFFLKSLGFCFNEIPNSTIGFWIYEPKSIKNKVPICLLHGVGIGLTPYALLIHKIRSKYPDRKIILLVFPFISAQLYSKIETRDAILYAIDKLFSICNIFTCSWLAHSFGCLIATYICHHRSRYITKLSLVEPVNIRAWDARLPSYLIYMNPTSFTHGIFCSAVRDFVVAHAIARNFIWHNSIIQPKDLQAPTNFFISKKDWLVDGAELIRYIDHNFGKLSHVGLNSLETSHGWMLVLQDDLVAIIDKL